MSVNISVVHEGEASESSDDEDKSRFLDTSDKAGVVVAGEASESSSDDQEVQQLPGASRQSPPPLVLHLDVGEKEEQVVELSSPDVPEQSKYSQGPTHNSLLHRKLREKNVQLRSHLKSYFSDIYSTGAKDLSSIAAHAGKSHAMMRDISNTMRLVSNDLFQLEDKVDIVASCSILPDLRLPHVELPTAPS